MPTFGDVVKALRIEKGLTQTTFADALSKTGEDLITRSAVSMWEANQRRPKFETLENIADFFNVDMDYLLGKTQKRHRYDLNLQFFAEKSMDPELEQQHQEVNEILDRMPPEVRIQAIAVLKALAPPGGSRDDS